MKTRKQNIPFESIGRQSLGESPDVNILRKYFTLVIHQENGQGISTCGKY